VLVEHSLAHALELKLRHPFENFFRRRWQNPLSRLLHLGFWSTDIFDLNAKEVVNATLSLICDRVHPASSHLSLSLPILVEATLTLLYDCVYPTSSIRAFLLRSEISRPSSWLSVSVDRYPCSGRVGIGCYC